MTKMMLGRGGSARDAGAMKSDASSAAARIASVRNMISSLLANRGDFPRLPGLVHDVVRRQIRARLAPVGGRRRVSFRHLRLTDIRQCPGEPQSNELARNDLPPNKGP